MAIPWAVALRHWIVVVAWMGVISYMSTDAFSAHNTNLYIDPVLRALFPGISNREILTAHTFVRKTAHFSEFFILSVLAFWAFRSGRPLRWRSGWMLCALLLSGLFALVDEGHQVFTSSRTPSVADSAIDFFGAAVAQIAVYVRAILRAGSG